ncbi:hypothetical protein LZC95_30555 [Pendulispora brunnea]|uniref:Uncharacterized protein n=1 Tax=Pendulispora brunnea TaxID=2905690 RepID=A0ABZ2JWC1_9BACT
MAIRELDRFLVVVTIRTPNDAEWDRYLQLYESPETRAKRVLVYASASPSASQRLRLRVAEGEYPPRKAVLACTKEARVAAVAASWFNSQLRLFSAADIDPALDFIGAAGSERTQLRRTLDDLRRELSMPRSTRAI